MANLLTHEGGERSKLQTMWVWGWWWENGCFQPAPTRGWGNLQFEGWVLGELDPVHFAPCAVHVQISRYAPCNSPLRIGQGSHRVMPCVEATHKESTKWSHCWRPELKHTDLVTCLWLKKGARIAGIAWTSKSPEVRSCVCKTKAKAGGRQFLRQERLRHK